MAGLTHFKTIVVTSGTTAQKNRGSHVRSSRFLNLVVPTLLNTGSKAFNIINCQLFASSLKDCSPLCIFICTSGYTVGVLGDLSKPPVMMDPIWTALGLDWNHWFTNGWTPTGWAEETDVFVQKYPANIPVFSINLCSPDLDYLALK